jgi:(2R)-ethylmalonyl-CoA mutase
MALARERNAAMREWRVARDQAVVSAAQEKLDRAVREGDPTIEPTLELARGGGTVGEWSATIERATNGRYVPPILDRAAVAQNFQVPVAPRKIRVALGKAGLDGHINAVKLLALACMQAGMEVILAGFKQTPAQLVEAALQEDADILAISSLAGAHLTIAREAIAILREQGASGVKLVMGGIIPPSDAVRLRELGVSAVFTPKDSNLRTIVERMIALGSEA